MRRVLRPLPGPSILRAPYTRGAKRGLTEFDLAEEHVRSGKSGSFEYKRYKEDAVRDALEEMFARKCAYCESAYDIVQPVDIEHFRPKNAVEGVDNHRGYWWLAMDWENLLPSCIDCNRRRDQKLPARLGETLLEMTHQRMLIAAAGKRAIFPVEDEAKRWTCRDDQLADDGSEEGRLLLDPTRDDPADHLAFCVDSTDAGGLVYARPSSQGGPGFIPEAGAAPSALSEAADSAGASRKGAASIHIYGLNRNGLVQARIRLMRDIEFLYNLVFSLTELVDDLQDRLAVEGDDALTGADLALTRRVATKLEALRADAMARMRAKVADDAPYAEFARACVGHLRDRLTASDETSPEPE